MIFKKIYFIVEQNLSSVLNLYDFPCSAEHKGRHLVKCLCFFFLHIMKISMVQKKHKQVKFGTTWWWIHEDRLFVYGWTTPLHKVQSDINDADAAQFAKAFTQDHTGVIQSDKLQSQRTGKLAPCAPSSTIRSGSQKKRNPLRSINSLQLVWLQAKSVEISELMRAGGGTGRQSVWLHKRADW